MNIVGLVEKTFDLRTKNRQDLMAPKAPKFNFTVVKGKS